MSEIWGPNCVVPPVLCMLGSVQPLQLFRCSRRLPCTHAAQVSMSHRNQEVLAGVQVGRIAQEMMASYNSITHPQHCLMMINMQQYLIPPACL